MKFWFVYCGCLPFDRKIRLGWKHNGKRFTSFTVEILHLFVALNPNQGQICVAWVWNREGTEKLADGKQHSIWFVPTEMKGLPQNLLLNFLLKFPEKWPYHWPWLPSGISEIFYQMVSTLYVHENFENLDIYSCKLVGLVVGIRIIPALKYLHRSNFIL